MGRPKKEKEEEETFTFTKVKQEKDLVDDELLAAEKKFDAQVLAHRAEHLEVLMNLETKISNLEKELEVSRSLKLTLTDEQKKAVEFAIKWVAHLRRQSRGVEFRTEAQKAITTLGYLL